MIINYSNLFVVNHIDEYSYRILYIFFNDEVIGTIHS